MRIKISFLLLLLSASVTSFAQISAADFSVGAAGNFTMYKGDFQRSTPGVKLEVAYGVQKKVGYLLAFTKGFAIKSPSSITSYNGVDEKSTSSQIQTSFSTVTLGVNYRFIGDADTHLNVYAPIGASYVMATSKEKANEAIPAGYTAMDQMEKDKQTGFTINVGIGAMYKIGMPMIFADAGLALPANQVGDEYVENYIPLHFFVNVGVRFAFGSDGGDD